MSFVRSLLGVFLWVAASAYAADGPSTVKPILIKASHQQGEVIVQWDREAFAAVVGQDDRGEPVIEIELTGKVDPSNSYLMNYRPLHINSDGSFKTRLALHQEVSVLRFIRVLQSGQVNKEPSQETLTVLEWENAQKTLLEAPRRAWSFLVGAGVTSLGYTQSNSAIGKLTSTAATIKLGTDYRVPKSKWILGLMGFMNVASFTKADPATAFKFMGLNFRAGRSIGILKHPWDLSLHGGLYFLTMQTNGTFGFANVAGPQIYPALRYTLKNGNLITFYAKYSPISDKLGIMSPSNYELAAGFGYLMIGSKIKKSINLDLSTVNITTVDNQGQVTTAKSNSITLGGTLYF